MSFQASIGNRQVYETGDQEHYSTAEVDAANRTTPGINAAGYSTHSYSNLSGPPLKLTQTKWTRLRPSMRFKSKR